jgi:hypothetical protein
VNDRERNPTLRAAVKRRRFCTNTYGVVLIMALTLGAIPAPVFRTRTFDPNTPNPNGVQLRTHGPRPATLDKISSVFWEKNVGTDERPRYVSARESDEGAVPRVRVTVVFTKLRNLEGQPLKLSTKWTASTGEKANLTKLVAGILGIAPKAVASLKDLNLESLYGSPVLATTKAGNKDQIAVLTTIVAATNDDDDETQVVAPASPAPARAAAVPGFDPDDLLEQYQATRRQAPPQFYSDEDFPDEIPF